MDARIEKSPLGLKQLQQAARQCDPEFWGALSGDDLAHLKTLCQRHWVNRIVSLSPWRLYLGVAAVHMGISLLRWLWSGAGGGDRFLAELIEIAVISAIFSAIITALLCLGAAALISVLRLDRPTALLAKLQPVRDAERYAKHSLAYVSNSIRAQAYRERVLAQGRELCVIDFEIMLRLARVDAY